MVKVYIKHFLKLDIKKAYRIEDKIRKPLLNFLLHLLFLNKKKVN